MTEKFILSVGLNDKDSKQQKIDTIESSKIIENVLINNGINGGTILNAVGFYTHDDGTVIREPSLRIELLFTDKTTVMAVCKVLKSALNQESIALEQLNTNSELV